MVDLKKSRLNRLRQKYALVFYVLHYLHGIPVGCQFGTRAQVIKRRGEGGVIVFLTI